MSGVRWKKLTCTGDQPEPRWGHTSSQSGANIVIIGGTGGKLFNDVCVYDTLRNTWTKPEVRGTTPTPRLGHSTTTLPDGKLLVFGGRTESKHYADMYPRFPVMWDYYEGVQQTLNLFVDSARHIFDPSRLAWVKSMQSPKSYPESRAGHTAILAPDQTRIVVFGGTSAHYKYFTNTFTLDISSLTWTKQDTKGEAPPKRGGHCAFAAYNKMFIFGGFDGKKYYNDLYCLTLDTFMWSKVEASGTLPKPRSGHSATLINGGTQLLVFGGCGANSDFLSDVHVLHLSDMHWDQPKCVGVEPQPRFRHTCSEVGNYLYIFSGTGSGNLLSDMMQLEIDTISPPLSPAMHTTFQHVQPTHIPHMQPPQHMTPPIQHMTPPIQHMTPPITLQSPTTETPEKYADIDVTELRKLYVAAMMALKAEKQQREDFEITAMKLDRELGDTRHQIAVEKSMRVAVEERLLEEHRITAKLEQSTSTKIDKVTKKKQKALQVLQENLTKEQQQQQLLTQQISDLTDDLAKEKQKTKELKQSLTNVELRSQEGVYALTKELEEMKHNNARIKIVKRELTRQDMHGEELDILSLNELIALEERHTQAYHNIYHARTKRQAEENEAKVVQLQQLKLENQRLETGKVEMESQIRTLTSNLNRCEDALSAQQTENETLKEKARRLEGSHMDGLTLAQLVELENMHHAGLRRVSQLRQEHMQNQLEELRKEKEALQEKQLCIVSFT